jgi:hypothetical protein
MNMNRAYGFSAVRGLTEAELMRKAPSIFAEHAHDRTSSRYTYIPTIELVRGLEKEGYLPTAATETRTRDESRRGFAKHLLRFRHLDDMNTPAVVGDSVPEIVLLNSHDGSSSYQLHAGMFRFVCANGMVVGDSMIDTVRVNHSGDILGNVIEGVYQVVNELPRAVEQIEQFQGVTLDRGEVEIFGKAAMALRWDEPESCGFTPEQLTRARRTGDTTNDLWTVLNRTQENMIRGGLHGWRRDANNRPRRTTSREVKGVDGNVRLNKAIWTLAEEFAKLKGLDLAA